MRTAIFIASLCPLLLSAEVKDSSTPAKPTEQLPDYVRWVEEDSGDSLQTAVATFRRDDGATVDLIGAVHIADKGYYKLLNERFRSYQALLYELVGGPMPTTEEQKAARAKNREASSLAWVGKLHQLMQESLELSSQMTEVDYSPANFVHADVTMEEFQKLREEKNESFLGLMVKAWAVQMDLQSKGKMSKEPDLAQLMALLMSGDGATELKRIIGAQFDSVEDLIAGIESGEGSVIITARNNAALKVMDAQLAAGKKKLGIFYGAAHLADMETSLEAKGWKKVKTEWVKAWTIPASPPEKP